MTWFQKEFAKLADRIADSLPANTLIEKAVRYTARKLLRKMATPAETIAIRLARRALLDNAMNGMRSGETQFDEAITAANQEDFEE